MGKITLSAIVSLIALSSVASFANMSPIECMTLKARMTSNLKQQQIAKLKSELDAKDVELIGIRDSALDTQGECKVDICMDVVTDYCHDVDYEPVESVCVRAYKNEKCKAILDTIPGAKSALMSCWQVDNLAMIDKLKAEQHDLTLQLNQLTKDFKAMKRQLKENRADCLDHHYSSSKN